MRIPFPFTLKVGADIVLRSRIARFANADPSRLRRFVAKLLHPAEVVELDRRFPTWHEAREQTLTRQAGLVSFLAGRWTAKEAAKKAWGASILSFKDLRVEVSEEEGDVQVVCSIAIPTSPEQIEQVARLSISHDGEYAIAVVIASPLDPGIRSELGRRKSDAEVIVKV